MKPAARQLPHSDAAGSNCRKGRDVCDQSCATS
jgi:hypothetical protein